MALTMRHRCRSGLILALGLGAAIASAMGARLPVRQYTTSDGLPHDRVTRIVHDSYGFLWFCTPAGLGRFDGAEFVVYRETGELELAHVMDVVEGPAGDYWIALWQGGLVRLDPAARDPAALLRRVDGDYPLETRRVYRDARDRIWVATRRGLFRIDDPSSQAAPRRVPLRGNDPSSEPSVWDVLVDRRGTVWVATHSGELLTFRDNGPVRSVPVLTDGKPRSVRCLLEDRAGRIWVGHDLGVTVYDPDAPGEPTWHSADTIGKGIVLHILQLSDGTIWMTRHKEGLTSFDGERFVQLTEAEGLPSSLPRQLAEDRAGNLWIGTFDSGALRLASTGFTAFDREDGLLFSRSAAILEEQGAGVLVVAGDTIYRFDGDGFEAIRPEVLRGLDTGRENDNPVVLQDRHGGWWIGTTDGLFRYGPQPASSLARARPIEAWQEGLAAEDVEALFEDSRGDVWFATTEPGLLGRWIRTSGTLRTYGIEDGLPDARPYGFSEHPSGDLWIGMSEGLVRYRGDDFEAFGAEQGLPVLHDVTPYVDRDGRLWALSRGDGVLRSEHPEWDEPAFEPLDVELPSRLVRSAVEDSQGRIYLGTGAGVVRLEPGSRHTRRFTTADGLSNNEIAGSLMDRDGALWFTSIRGVSRWVPSVESSASDPGPPPIRITALRIAGEFHPVAELGETRIAGLRIPHSRSQLEIQFGSLSFGIGQTVRYRYQLEGADGGWSTPSLLRTIHYANLSPGRYRFRVQAVDPDGRTSARPASIDFRVLPPLWLRGWFLALLAAGLAGLIYAIYRYRVARLLDLERVRTRIATDLHDDLGTSLSRISILSEVARRIGGVETPEVSAIVSEIGETARDLADSTGDIVWSVDPTRDDLRSLSSRLRQFASDVLEGRGIALDFQSPEDAARVRLTPEARRHLFLILKEAVNNAARHSGATRVTVLLRAEGSKLHAEVRDDGRGFVVGEARDGNGLQNMARRAEEAHGRFQVDSTPEKGTRLRVVVPLR